MPGRSPHKAVEEFLGPLRAALACLSPGANIVTSRSVRELGDEATWVLNGGTGLKLGGGLAFYATQAYRVATCDDPAAGRFRVSTRAYLYKLHSDGAGDLWRMHWHPGREEEMRPHLHLPPDLDRHLPTGRMTLEKAVEWCIRYGATANCADWPDRLHALEAKHIQYRTWNEKPLNQTTSATSRVMDRVRKGLGRK